MPRRSDRLSTIVDVNIKKRKNSIAKKIKSHVSIINNHDFEYSSRLYHVYRAYDILYKNFYTCWTDHIRPSFIRSAYLHIRVVKRDLNIVTHNNNSISENEKLQIQKIDRIFKKFRQLYDNERTYLFKNVLDIHHKLSPDIVYYIDTFL